MIEEDLRKKGIVIELKNRYEKEESYGSGGEDERKNKKGLKGRKKGKGGLDDKEEETVINNRGRGKLLFWNIAG